MSSVPLPVTPLDAQFDPAQKKEWLSTPVEHIDITSFDARTIVDQMGKMSFTSRDLARASEIYGMMLADPSCRIIILTKTIFRPVIMPSRTLPMLCRRDPIALARLFMKWGAGWPRVRPKSQNPWSSWPINTVCPFFVRRLRILPLGLGWCCIRRVKSRVASRWILSRISGSSPM